MSIRMCRLCVLTVLVFAGLLQSGALASAHETTELRFGEPLAAVISARYWDQTQQEWHGNGAEMFFDAVHRFLLLRFPGSAEAVHERLRDGRRIASVELSLTWKNQEFRRVSGYSWRGWHLENRDPPRWHARAWLLRQPWTDDPEIGPTWNAAINAALYWAAGGARMAHVDRSANSTQKVEISEQHRTARLDVTNLLLEGGRESLAQRLHTMESAGFLVAKDEMIDHAYGQQDFAIGIARIWVEAPELIVTLERGDAGIGELPTAVNVRALAERLREEGPRGFPTSRIPQNYAELARRARSKPDDMPEWMWERVQEVRRLKSERWEDVEAGRRPEDAMFDEMESGDPEALAQVLDMVMSRPPGWFMGHRHLWFMLPLLQYEAMLPDAVRYHLRRNFLTHWQPPYLENVFRHRVGYFGGMATLNHQSQFRAEAALASERLGLTDLAVQSSRNLELLNRQMIFSEGTSQEHGDTFYLGIQLNSLQTLARYGTNPLNRLRADLAVEKLVEEMAATYHPGLRRRVSPISRRYRLRDLILGQDTPRAVLHMLSRDGVLLHMDEYEVHGLHVNNFNSFPPAYPARLAPWGKPWDTNIIDDKSLPFARVGARYKRGLLDEPIYTVSYLGNHYALASRNMDIGQEWPVLAKWKRRAQRVETLDDLGILFPWFYINERLVHRVHKGWDRDTRADRIANHNPPAAALQHENKMIYTVSLPKRDLLENVEREGLRSVTSRMCIYAFGPSDEREIWVGERRADSLPVTLVPGDIVTIQEGVSYVGLIAYGGAGPDAGRAVVIREEHPLLALDMYLMRSDMPLSGTDETWRELADAAGGWIVELGDATAYGSFAAFRNHMRQTALETHWDAGGRTLHVSYSSAGDKLELGYLTAFEHPDRSEPPLPPSAMLAYQRVNGQWPWLPEGIDADSPVSQLGRARTLRKGGATLETAEGRSAMLRVEPISGIYQGVNPYVDPTPFELRTPEGVVIRSEGPLGMGRIVAQPAQNKLWVDYALPPPGGDRGAEKLQHEAAAGERAGSWYETCLSKFMHRDLDVREARANSARALIVEWPDGPPTVILNGKEIEEPPAAFTRERRTWYRIPIVRGE